MNKKLTVIICPLDWGLGHASRDIPLIREIIKADFSVLLAGDGLSLDLLHHEFPELKTIKLPSVKISYSSSNSLAFKMIKQIPIIITGILKEHQLLKKILADTGADLVISDNRFGLWNKKVYSIYITHQLWIKLPNGFRFFERMIHILHRSLISRYDTCWVPDKAHHDNNLSGSLSHIPHYGFKGTYIGVLSRFSNYLNKPVPSDFVFNDINVLAIVSGPEPQRTIFENILIPEMKNLPYKILIIRGLPGDKEKLSTSDHIQFKNHLKTEHFYYLIKKAKYIICRSGYSTLMDLVTAGRRAVLIPTPGQPEQEYLASHFSEKYAFSVRSQDRPDLEKAFMELDQLEPDKLQNIMVPDNLGEVVKDLKSELTVKLKNVK